MLYKIIERESTSQEPILMLKAPKSVPEFIKTIELELEFCQQIYILLLIMLANLKKGFVQKTFQIYYLNQYV